MAEEDSVATSESGKMPGKLRSEASAAARATSRLELTVPELQLEAGSRAAFAPTVTVAEGLADIGLWGCTVTVTKTGGTLDSDDRITMAEKGDQDDGEERIRGMSGGSNPAAQDLTAHFCAGHANAPSPGKLQDRNYAVFFTEQTGYRRVPRLDADGDVMGYHYGAVTQRCSLGEAAVPSKENAPFTFTFADAPPGTKWAIAEAAEAHGKAAFERARQAADELTAQLESKLATATEALKAHEANQPGADEPEKLDSFRRKKAELAEEPRRLEEYIKLHKAAGYPTETNTLKPAAAARAEDLQVQKKTTKTRHGTGAVALAVLQHLRFVAGSAPGTRHLTLKFDGPRLLAFTQQVQVTVLPPLVVTKPLLYPRTEYLECQPMIQVTRGIKVAPATRKVKKLTLTVADPGPHDEWGLQLDKKAPLSFDGRGTFAAPLRVEDANSRMVVGKFHDNAVDVDAVPVTLLGPDGTAVLMMTVTRGWICTDPEMEEMEWGEGEGGLLGVRFEFAPVDGAAPTDEQWTSAIAGLTLLNESRDPATHDRRLELESYDDDGASSYPTRELEQTICVRAVDDPTEIEMHAADAQRSVVRLAVDAVMVAPNLRLIDPDTRFLSDTVNVWVTVRGADDGDELVFIPPLPSDSEVIAGHTSDPIYAGDHDGSVDHRALVPKLSSADDEAAVKEALLNGNHHWFSVSSKSEGKTVTMCLQSHHMDGKSLTHLEHVEAAMRRVGLRCGYSNSMAATKKSVLFEMAVGDGAKVSKSASLNVLPALCKARVPEQLSGTCVPKKANALQVAPKAALGRGHGQGGAELQLEFSGLGDVDGAVRPVFAITMATGNGIVVAQNGSLTANGRRVGSIADPVLVDATPERHTVKVLPVHSDHTQAILRSLAVYVSAAGKASKLNTPVLCKLTILDNGSGATQEVYTRISTDATA